MGNADETAVIVELAIATDRIVVSVIILVQAGWDGAGLWTQFENHCICYEGDSNFEI